MTTNSLELYIELIDRLEEAMGDTKKGNARKKGISAVSNAREEAKKRFTDLEDSRDLLRRLKTEVMENLDENIRKLSKSLEEASCTVHFARTGAEARKIIGGLIGTEKLIVKSKSNAGKEIDLVEHLEAQGNQVIETDLGDLICQLGKSRGTHPIVPALHFSAEEIAEIFKQEWGEEVPPDASAIAEAARRKIREFVLKADFGFSGGNMLTIDEGTLGIITNEGNGRLVTSIPPIHIALVALNKLIPSIVHGGLTAKLISTYATGQRVPCYLSLVTGPSRTGDVEFEVVLGAHGPKELHIVLLDNGRTEAVKDSILREALYCVNCGSCSNVCPIYDQIGENYGGTYPSGIGIIYEYINKLAEASHREALVAAVNAGLFLCAGCGTCKENCPVRIDTPEILRYLRKLAVEEGLHPPALDSRLDNIRELGNPFRIQEGSS